MVRFIPGGLVVDVDDTICDTMRRCCELTQRQFQCPGGVDADQLLEKHGFHHRVPDWQTPTAQTFMIDLLNKTEFLKTLPPIKPAVAAVQKLNQIVPVGLYLTSRTTDKQTVTEQWLANNHLPLAPVITRDPTITVPDWKVSFLAENYPDSFGLIDNEMHLQSAVGYAGYLLEIPLRGKLTPNHSSITTFSTWEELISFVGQRVPNS